MRRSYFVVLVLSLGFLAGATALGRIPFLAFIDAPTLVLVPGIAILMSFASMTPREVGRCFGVAFSSAPADRAGLERARVYFDSLARYLAYGGATGTGMGGIAMLLFLGEPESVGKGLALSLLSALYAVVFIVLVALPFGTAVRRRLADLPA